MTTTQICTDCRRTLPLEVFYSDRSRRRGVEKRCRPCSNRRRAERYQRRVDALAAGEGVRSTACDICGVPVADRHGTPLHLDVDRDTARVRGRLCARCSSGLGLFATEALLVSASEYLARFAQRREDDEAAGE